MQVQIRILVENTSNMPGVWGEYGFAALITTPDARILFDTGSEGTIFNNAAFLGEDLKSIKNIVISHGHFDHTGGIIPLLKQNPDRRIHIHPHAFAIRKVQTIEGNVRDIGSKFMERDVKSFGSQIVWVNDFTELCPHLFITGEIPRTNDFEEAGSYLGKKFQVIRGSETLDDNIEDDMAIVINHSRGLIIVSGCAHAGIINTIEYARKKTGKSQILAFIGGTHLMTVSEDRLEKTINYLKDSQIETLILSHCTGFHAAARMYDALGDKVMLGTAGTYLEFK